VDASLGKVTTQPLPLIGYLRSLTAPRITLWCYLLWYAFVAFRYFDPSPRLWLSSCGISVIIGTALYLSTARAGSAPVKLDRWQIVRLYMMPFCVSSFAALIKGQGFVLVFHPTLRANLEAAGICAAFVALVAATKATARDS
jgi:hypothetical protein